MNYIKNSFKVLFGYLVSLLVFAIFIYVFISLAKDNISMLLPYYSLLFFFMAFAIVYTDMKKLAEKEKKPQYNFDPYPLKGLVYGFIGFLPVILIVVVSFFVTFGNQFADHLKHLAINTLMGPLFFIIRIASEAPLGYIAACLVIPVIAMLGYLAGFYGFNVTGYLKKKDNSKTAQPTFRKSPWNPTNKSAPAPVKKKKKVGGEKKIQ